MGFFLIFYMLFFSASIAMGDTVLPACKNLQDLLAPWGGVAGAAAALAGSMGTIHVVTQGLLALPFIQQYVWIVRILQVLSVFGFNAARPKVCATQENTTTKGV